MWYAYTMEFPIKNDEVIKFIENMMEIEGIMSKVTLLSERQTLHILAATLDLVSKS